MCDASGNDANNNQINWNDVEPWQFNGNVDYQCVICGNWDNDIEHILYAPEWFEALWDVSEMGQMMPMVFVTPQNEMETTITIGNVTKPFVCAQCQLDECGHMD